jgi:hypothetical protein
VPPNSKKSTTRLGSTKPNSRGGPVAGPSSKPASGPTGTKRKNNRSPEPSDSDDLYGPPDPQHAEEAIVVPPAKSKAKKGLADVAANGKPISKGKGKAKAEPPSKPKAALEPMEVDDDEVEVIEDTGEAKPTTRGANAKTTKSATTTTRPAKNDRELSRLKQSLAEVRLAHLFFTSYSMVVTIHLDSK